MTEQQDHEAKLAALRAATDDGDACDPATDSDTETSKALTEQFMDEIVANSKGDGTAVDEQPKKRPSGLFKGTLGPGFFEPLSEDELRLWNGEEAEIKPEASEVSEDRVVSEDDEDDEAAEFERVMGIGQAVMRRQRNALGDLAKNETGQSGRGTLQTR